MHAFEMIYLDITGIKGDVVLAESGRRLEDWGRCSAGGLGEAIGRFSVCTGRGEKIRRSSGIIVGTKSAGFSNWTICALVAEELEMKI